MTKQNILIYGSYGYSGNLIAKLACKDGLTPILAGRNLSKLQTQANKLRLSFRCFDTTNLQTIIDSIKDCIAVLHCAGPFINTYENMALACIATNTHYLDITGEYKVIENLSQMNQRALDAKVMLLPGVGFDVVPSDCLAQYLKQQLPDASELTLAIHTRNKDRAKTSISRGTAKTVLGSIAEGTMIRDQGKLKKVPLAWKKRFFNFGNLKMISCTTISWGDLASAWWSTRIPHIETYMSTPEKTIKIIRFLNPIRFIFKLRMINQYLQNKINRLPEGPDDNELQNSTTFVYGEVKNPHRVTKSSMIAMPHGYQLTALAAVHIVKKVLSGLVPIGFQTPSTAYTSELILEIEGTSRVNCVENTVSVQQ